MIYDNLQMENNFIYIYLVIIKVRFGSITSWVIFFDFLNIYLNIFLKMVILRACIVGILGLVLYFYNYLKFYFSVYFTRSI